MPLAVSFLDRQRDASPGREIVPGRPAVYCVRDGDFVRWMTWITDSGADAELKTREQRTAAEQYVAAHFRWQLTRMSSGTRRRLRSNRFSVGDERRRRSPRAIRRSRPTKAGLCRRHRRPADPRVGSPERRLERKLPRRCRGAPGALSPAGSHQFRCWSRSRAV